MEYLKSKENSTFNQQLQNIRERLNLEAEAQSARMAKIERDSLNQSELTSHLGVNMLEMQKIVDGKYEELSTELLDQKARLFNIYNNTTNFKRQALVIVGVITIWLTTLSILILRHG